MLRSAGACCGRGLCNRVARQPSTSDLTRASGGDGADRDKHGRANAMHATHALPGHLEGSGLPGLRDSDQGMSALHGRPPPSCTVSRLRRPTEVPLQSAALCSGIRGDASEPCQRSSSLPRDDHDDREGRGKMTPIGAADPFRFARTDNTGVLPRRRGRLRGRLRVETRNTVISLGGR